MTRFKKPDGKGNFIDVSPEEDKELSERFDSYEREMVQQYLSGMTIKQISRDWLEPEEDIVWHLKRQGINGKDKS